MKNVKTISILAVLSLLPVVAFGIVGGSDPSDVSDALDAAAAFGRASLLGQGSNPAADHAWHCSAVLVTPGAALTATHCLSAYGEEGGEGGYALRFRRRVDGGIGSVEEGAPSFHHVGVSGFFVPPAGDTSIVYLKDEVTHVAPIRTVLADSLAPGSRLILAGWGREGPGFGEGRRHRLLACDTSVSALAAYVVLWPSLLTGCGPNSNDSGGPAIEVLASGELRVVATITGPTHGTRLSRYAAYREFQALVQ